MSMQHIQDGVRSAWKKSSYSGAHGDCVEVRTPGRRVITVRDSKDPQGPALTFTPQAWASFVADVDSGAFGRF